MGLRPRQRCSACACATPSADACASPATATSRGPSKERSAVPDIPVAYSAGFSPHPKISYAGAAPTGVASEAEYLEIGVTTPCDPQQVRTDLDGSLPPGLDVLDVVEAGPGALADRLEVSEWEVRLRDADRDLAVTAVEKFLAAGTVEVERLMKKGPRRFDAREAVLRLTVPEGNRGNRSSGGWTVVCHTAHGCSAHDACRSTRRCAHRAAPCGRLRAAGPPRGDQAGAGAAGRQHRCACRPARPGPRDYARRRGGTGG